MNIRITNSTEQKIHHFCIYEADPKLFINNFAKCMRNHGFKNIVRGDYGGWIHVDAEKINGTTIWDDETGVAITPTFRLSLAFLGVDVTSVTPRCNFHRRCDVYENAIFQQNFEFFSQRIIFSVMFVTIDAELDLNKLIIQT